MLGIYQRVSLVDTNLVMNIATPGSNIHVTSSKNLDTGNPDLDSKRFNCHSFLSQEQNTAKTLYSGRLSKQDPGKPEVVVPYI